MAPNNPADLSEGSVFHGRYRIARCLKAGGMGAVYECVHLTTDKRRALKVMLPSVIANPGMRERFELEARVTARIESEHVVETFDAGVDEATGAPFLVMELLRGDDLDTILKSHGPFGAAETVALLSQAALALDRTHAAGIVHRDLKPQNLFLTTRDDGAPRLKILDFGIAKVVADGTKTAQETAAIGTPVYMSPEQTTGDGAIGPAADLYALGHIAYTLLTGEAYWRDEQRSLPLYGFLSGMLAGPTERPSVRAARRDVALPLAFDAWFLRATTRSPAARFDRASTQVAELAAALGTPAPRQLLATPPPLSHRLSIADLGGAPQGSSGSGSLSQPTGNPPSHPGVQAQSTRAAPTGGTIGPTTQGPIGAPAVSSRTPLLAVAAVGLLAGMAAGIFGLVRARGGPATASAVADSAAATSTAATSATPTAAAPTVAPFAPAPAIAVTAASSVVSSAAPLPDASANATASAANRASPTEAPKKQAAAPAYLRTAPPKSAAAPKAPSCSPPFTVDASGVKHAKPECL